METIAGTEIPYMNVQLLPHNQSLAVYIAGCTSPSSFWVQFTFDFHEFHELQENLNRKMEEWLAKSYFKPQSVQLGETVTIKDGEFWHRGLVTRIKDSRASVTLRDWGRIVTRPIDRVYHLTEEFRTLPWRAIACKLANAQPLHLHKAWRSRGSDLFRGLAEGREGQVWIHPSSDDRTALVDLYVLREGYGYVDIKQEMQAWGYLGCTQNYPEGHPLPCESLDYNEQ